MFSVADLGTVSDRSPGNDWHGHVGTEGGTILMVALIDTETGGAVGHHIAGNALIAWVYLMASEGGVFAFASLPLVNERLPLLSDFGPKRFKAGIGC